MLRSTSGLRKKTKVFETTPNYVENFVQATFNAVGLDVLKGQTLVVGGGRTLFQQVHDPNDCAHGPRQRDVTRVGRRERDPVHPGSLLRSP